MGSTHLLYNSNPQEPRQVRNASVSSDLLISFHSSLHFAGCPGPKCPLRPLLPPLLPHLAQSLPRETRFAPPGKISSPSPAASSAALPSPSPGNPFRPFREDFLSFPRRVFRISLNLIPGKPVLSLQGGKPPPFLSSAKSSSSPR